MKRRAFTLIELLVVIAIIAILAAILFPVFAKAREKARQASCLSNLKQVNLGIMQYTQDFDEKFPLQIGYEGYWWYAYYKWDPALGYPDDSRSALNGLFPYTKNHQILSCPSGNRSTNTYTPAPYSQNTNYNYNGWAHNKSLAGPTEPAKIIIFWEGMGKQGIDGDVANPFLSGFNAQGNGTGWSLWYGFTSNGDCHNQGHNYSFIDGHAKWANTSSRMGAYTASPGSAGWGVNWDNLGWYTGLAP